MPPEKPQQFVIHLPVGLARRVLAIVNASDSAYESLSELLVVALENQLELERVQGDQAVAAVKPLSPEQASATPAASRSSQRGQSPASGPPPRPRTARPQRQRPGNPPRSAQRNEQRDLLASLIARPAASPDDLREPGAAPGAPLSAMTNRLNPLVVGPRVLANLTLVDGPPTVDVFSKTAALAARHAGTQIREDDARDNRRGRHRRWTGWPVGDEEQKSLSRFRRSFLVSADGAGPLAELQLLVVEDGKVYLTTTGAQFACEPVPGLDGGGAELLSEAQRVQMARLLLVIDGERTAIIEFLRVVEETDGRQDGVDKQIAHSHPDWSDAQVVSHRAAMIGRLRDLAVLDVDTTTEGKTAIAFDRYINPFRDLLEAAARRSKEQ